MQKSEEIKELETKLAVTRLANETAVLLNICAEKMDITYGEQFWQDFIKKYNEVQKESHEARQTLEKLFQNAKNVTDATEK